MLKVSQMMTEEEKWADSLLSAVTVIPRYGKSKFLTTQDIFMSFHDG